MTVATRHRGEGHEPSRSAATLPVEPMRMGTSQFAPAWPSGVRGIQQSGVRGIQGPECSVIHRRRSQLRYATVL